MTPLDAASSIKADDLDDGAIAGIAVGAAVVVLALGAGLIYAYMKKQSPGATLGKQVPVEMQVSNTGAEERKDVEDEKL